MTFLRAKPLSPARARLKVRAALAAAGAPVPSDAVALAAASSDLIRSLPDWVDRFGLLKAQDTIILWFDPRAGEGETFPSQIVLDLPPGRYFVDTLDVRSHQWISRESASGGPLVAGLPSTGRAVLVRIRACGV